MKTNELNNWVRAALIGGLVLGSTGLLAGCENEGPMEELGEEVDDIGDEIDDEI